MEDLNGILSCVICGLEKGGTTVLSELIRQSPSVDGRFECGMLLEEDPHKWVGTVHARGIIDNWGGTPAHLEAIVNQPTFRGRYKVLQDLLGTNLPLYDKCPVYLKHLNRTLYRANMPAVVIIRKPWAVYASETKMRHRYQVGDFCRKYNIYMEGLMSAMDRHPGRIHVTSLEALCHNHLASMDVYAFLGLEWDSSYFNFSAKHSNVRSGGFDDSVITEWSGIISSSLMEYIEQQTKPATDYAYSLVTNYDGD